MPHALSPDEKILVTGGTGFIGVHLLRALCASGSRPAALTRKRERVAKLAADVREQVRWQELDVRDGEAVQNFIQAERPDVIFHLAGTRGKGNGEESARLCAELNVRASANVLEAAKSAGVRRVILIGSADEYGRQAGPLKESLDLQPASVYGNSKAEATRLALEMFEEEAVPVVILRPFTVYGPQQPREMFVAEAIECAVNGMPFKMSEGTQKRDLIFVDDVVRALLAAASAHQVEGKVINIGSGRAESLGDVAHLIWKISESRAPLLIGARQASEQETHDTWADITQARQLLDWEPRVSLEEGLRAAIDWQIEHNKENFKSEISHFK
jgi:Nucleoside-diphosphate-sugar epimerases